MIEISGYSIARQRMLEDMAMRGLRQDTQRDHVRSVRWGLVRASYGW